MSASHACDSLGEVLSSIVHDQHGFLTPDDVEILASLDPLRPVLVRFHQFRAVVPAQDVRNLIEYAERGRACVRDVSLLASSSKPFAPANRTGEKW